ncbi:MAG: 1-acyl-sn-glycerol-3-phosphate acyltransferase [Lewinellaceae bacterium]|nr:1-acyl-sn-glycerol-3-phosphate acyltransferase [Lewinellaceae bacterium]
MAHRNAYINPILRLIYFLLRVLVWFGLFVLYRRRLVLGRKNTHFDGPAIVIVNHPSTLMDVLNPALEIWQEMFFLANYGMFKNPVAGWILRRFFCIPVKRKEDVAEGEERDNMQAFEKSFEHLEKNGVLFMAVEGTSWMNRFVRPLKTGVARISLGTEARNDWALGVKIIPIGLSYSAPDKFRSDVVVNFGAPVYARDWAEAWQENRHQGVSELINHLETQLKTLSIHTRDEAGEKLITQLEEILQNEQPLSQKAAFERSRQLVKTALDDPGLSAKTTAYFENLEQAKLADAVLAVEQKPALLLNTIWQGLGLIVGLPFFALGYAFWFLPCFLPWFLNKKMNLYIGYATTVKMLAGLITFPLALWGAWKLCWWYTHDHVMAGLALLTVILLGYFVEEFQDQFRKFTFNRKAVKAATSQPHILEPLFRQRREILDHLNLAVRQEPLPRPE